MKKQIGVLALAVLAAFAIGFAPGLARADGERQSTGWEYEGIYNIPGTVEMSHSGYVLKSSEGTFRLKGADASKLVGKKVKAFGELSNNEGTDVETLNVYQFVPRRA
jgi:hypothetical protein